MSNVIFEALIAKHGHSLRGTVIYYTPYHQRRFIDDLYQDCLVKLWNDFQKYDLNLAAFKTWARITVEFHMKNQLALRRYRDPVVELKYEDSSTSEHPDARMLDLLDGLTEEEKDIVQKYYVEKNTQQEVAELLNVSRRTIVRKLEVIKEKLKKTTGGI